MKKKVIIIGAGVAGLTAALEILETTDMIPVIYEQSDVVGGISKTINYKGNKMDIGGHRFFSKSEKVMKFWEKMLPVHIDNNIDEDEVMFVRNRVSRIFYMNHFFDYPIKFNIKTLRKLGFKKVIRISISYMKSMLFPIKNEKSLEDFFINRFGEELYKTFFKDYTAKVWGVPCSKIKPEWGAQRIKGISIKKVIKHAIIHKLSLPNKTKNISQSKIETSFIDQFLYPKYGVGQMWEKVAKTVIEKGGIIECNKKVIGLTKTGNIISKVIIQDQKTHMKEKINCEKIISTMPINEFISGMNGMIPNKVKNIAMKLRYRDFISIGVLLKKFNLGNDKGKENYCVRDNWIYIQDNNVKMGRIQIFNNWSPYMVNDSNNIWIGLEYFCNEGDRFWSLKDQDLIEFAIDELISINAIVKTDVIDSTVVRMSKAYPSYIGAYDEFDLVRSYLDEIRNLFLIGRNGMHRYNNMDHSMLTAVEAVKNIKLGNTKKDNIWSINSEKEYHEENSRQLHKN